MRLDDGTALCRNFQCNALMRVIAAGHGRDGGGTRRVGPRHQSRQPRRSSARDAGRPL